MTIEDVDRRADQARTMWRNSARAGRPITGAELGRRFGMSDRWGRDRVAEARDENPAAANGDEQTVTDESAADTMPDASADSAVTDLPALAPSRPSQDADGHRPLPHQRREAAVASAPPLVSTPSGPESAATALPSVPTWQRTMLICLALVFLVPGLGISAWSFYGYARAASAPMLLAGSASAAIDGIGLWAAFFAMRFTNRGQSARFTRLVTYTMIAASVYINWEHAGNQHWSTGLHVLVSAPAVAAAASFEVLMLELRVNERSRHEKRRRARQAAKVDAAMWLHHPVMVWSARRWESADRIGEIFPGYRVKH